jgi:hypothetical protein
VTVRSERINREERELRDRDVHDGDVVRGLVRKLELPVLLREARNDLRGNAFELLPGEEEEALLLVTGLCEIDFEAGDALLKL